MKDLPPSFEAIQTSARRKGYSRSYAYRLIFLCSVVLTAVAWNYADQHLHDLAQERFERRVNSTRDAVLTRMQQYQQFLNGGVGLFVGSSHVSRQEWHDFVENANIEQNFPGLQNMAVDFPIRAQDKAAHIASVRAEGFPNYTIIPEQPAREVYHSLVYVEPFSGRNLRAFGFDMYTNPIRREAMDRAIDLGMPSMSAAVKLVQENTQDAQYGFIFCYPVFHQRASLNSADERRKNLRALICGAFRMKDLMRGIFGTAISDVDLEIFDSGASNLDSSLYSSVGAMTVAHSDYRRELTTEIGGHKWLLRVTANQNFLKAAGKTQSILIAIGGILFNLGLFFALSTAKRREEDAIVRNEHNSNLFKSVMDCTTSFIHVRNTQGRYLYVNKEYESVFECRNELVCGKHYTEVLPEYFWATVRENDKIILQSGATLRTETIVHKESGSRVYLVIRSPLFDSAGRIIGTCGVGMDISPIKQLEQEKEAAFESLRLSEERWAFAIEGSGDGVWDWNLITNKVKLSVRGKEMLGYADSEIDDEVTEWEHRIHPDDRENVRREMNAHLHSASKGFAVELRLLCKDGSYKWIYDRGLIVKRDEQGRAVRMVGTMVDISKRKEIDRIKAEFISTVSHELRTPVTSIRGALGLLENGVMGQLEPKVMELVKVANRNSQRLITLVNDILDMEKLLSGKMAMNISRVSLRVLLQQAIDENAAYAAGFSVKINLVDCLESVDGGDEDCHIDADPDRVKQVLANLLSNAAKFSHAGDVVLLSLRKQENQVVVYVEDHGSGIPLDFQPRIFEAFAQADCTDTRQQGSTGLGLNISKKLIEQMGGEIGFTSEVGKGTCFWFALPLPRNDAPQDADLTQ
ncbi:CHASE domain-containing protein [Undibacterium flavidum]|uniref:histidine kinase n=1 Tax=Undibacterium flavidum TaxID=2762297 RepID=A0ABR6Y7L7_9BURK|nr:CHASE domain-containing protein [Undibacterium flavidum]MBC3872592.1 CHASE domain-containing protein [Undibacterium flavidum]